MPTKTAVPRNMTTNHAIPSHSNEAKKSAMNNKTASGNNTKQCWRRK
jgi:hypothetical protein